MPNSAFRDTSSSDALMAESSKDPYAGKRADFAIDGIAALD
ncbi:MULTISPECIES: hypothetical protein [unclassified Paraburkholderia]